jgi:hypothetical protein
MLKQIAPDFAQLEQIYLQIKQVKKQLAKADKFKCAKHFQKL